MENVQENSAKISESANEVFNLEFIGSCEAWHGPTNHSACWLHLVLHQYHSIDCEQCHVFLNQQDCSITCIRF